MFRKTRRQLVIVNAIVLLLILAGFSTLLYLHMKYRLFHQSDDILVQTEDRILHKRMDDLLRSPHPEPEGDRRTAYLFWDADGWLIDTLPKQSYTEEEAEHLKGSLKERSLCTVSFHGENYRVLQFPNPLMETEHGGEHSPVPRVAAVSLVRSLEAEEEMLGTLMMDIGFGIFAGVLFSVLAGFFLAGRALIPIRRSWEKQQRFVADASHELRTPTAVIQAQAEMLFRHPHHTIKDESPNIADILKESKRMGKLIEELLTLARTDSNQLQIRPAEVPISLTAEEAAGQFRFLADTKGVGIETDIQRDLTVWGDEERIRQLLVIVLDNALKFTPPGGNIRVTCRSRGHVVLLQVKDSGCGISSEDMPHIFERFYRADKARSRSEGGTGLGLSIAKWIVDTHGGEISVHSELSKGTEVRISLPRRKTGKVSQPAM